TPKVPQFPTENPNYGIIRRVPSRYLSRFSICSLREISERRILRLGYAGNPASRVHPTFTSTSLEWCGKSSPGPYWNMPDQLKIDEYAMLPAGLIRKTIADNWFVSLNTRSFPDVPASTL